VESVPVEYVQVPCEADFLDDRAESMFVEHADYVCGAF